MMKRVTGSGKGLRSKNIRGRPIIVEDVLNEHVRTYDSKGDSRNSE